MTGAWLGWLRVAWLSLVLAGCSLVSLTDRYGNSYGGWYNPGQQFQWQLATCDQAMAAASIPAPARKLAMRCCMWRHGVPIDDPNACQAPTASLSSRGEGGAQAEGLGGRGRNLGRRRVADLSPVGEMTTHCRAAVDSRPVRFLS